jgi:hypothetical protein
MIHKYFNLAGAIHESPLRSNRANNCVVPYIHTIRNFGKGLFVNGFYRVHEGKSIFLRPIFFPEKKKEAGGKPFCLFSQ